MKIGNRFLLDYTYLQVNHKKEEVCGDVINTLQTEDFLIIVLADGLGSGIRANILANLTVEITLKLMGGGLPIDEVITTLGETLPVCPIRNIAYSTFSIFQIYRSGFIKIYEFDNPDYIFFRNNEYKEIEKKIKEVGKYKIKYSEFRLQLNDWLIFFSDGVIHSGMGKTLPFGWERKYLLDFLNKKLPDIQSPKQICAEIKNMCLEYDLGEPEDDVSIGAIYLRLLRKVVIFTGPPQNPQDDQKVCKEFFAREGKKIICGGTTSQIVSRYLGKPVKVLLDSYEKDVPAMAKMEGVDLVTEGIITISKVCEMIQGKHFDYQKLNGVIRLYQELKWADEVEIFLGLAINEAYQNPEIPQILSLRKNVVEKLAELLVKYWNKKVKIEYF